MGKFTAEKLQSAGIFGAIIGVLTPVVLNFLSNLNIPGVSITQATIAVDFSLPDVGLGGWLANIVGVSLDTIPGNVYVLAAIGGAIFAILGSWILTMAENGNLLSPRTRQTRVAWILVFGTLAASWLPGLISGDFPSIPSFAALIALGISSAVLGFAYVFVFSGTGQEKFLPA